jgi:hypothetical protein
MQKKKNTGRSSPICRLAALFAALFLAILIAGAIHTSKVKRMFDDLPALRAEITEMEGDVRVLDMKIEKIDTACHY